MFQHKKTLTNRCLTALIPLGMALSAAPMAADAAERLPKCDRKNPDGPTSSQKSPFAGDSKFKGQLQFFRVYQHPTGGKCLEVDQLKAGKLKRNIFFRNRSQELVFQAPENAAARTRSELRGNNYSVTQKGARMTFNYKISGSRRHAQAAGFTIAQILSDTPEAHNDISGIPLVRLELIKSRNGKRDHLWAVTKKSENGSTSFTDLGKVNFGKSGYISIEWGNGGGSIRRASDGKLNTSSKIRINHNGSAKRFDINGIKTDRRVKHVYFKVGCYNQKDGSCNNAIKNLSFKNVPKYVKRTSTTSGTRDPSRTRRSRG